jgi:hypothetical protein
MIRKKVTAKLTLCLAKHHAMKTCVVEDVWFHAFLISALQEDEWLPSPLGRFICEEEIRGTFWIRDYRRE